MRMPAPTGRAAERTGRERCSSPGAAGARLDLVCSPGIESAAEELVRGWGRDRALSDASVDRLCLLVSTAMAHGLRFGPRAVTIRIAWLEAHRVHIDVRWRECSGATPGSGRRNDVERTAAILDANAARWGFGASTGDPRQWIVCDLG